MPVASDCLSLGLWQKVAAQSRLALHTGALQPIDTELEYVAEENIAFQLRQIKRLRPKPRQGKASPNPFLPPETALLVGAMGRGHLAVLNKYMVMPQHLLIVTRDYHPQTAPLTHADFCVASEALTAGPSLLFFNAGPQAGASQSHRHLQLIPLPLEDTGVCFPMAERLFSDDLPWQLFAIRTANLSARERAECWFDYYLHTLKVCWGVNQHAQQLPPYNILATEQGMVLIPRSQERVDGVSINALGYAGLLLVKNAEEKARLLQTGPLNFLTQAAQPVA